MAHHHASPYHDVENVRMIASPLFKVPSPISPPYDMHPLPEDIIQRRYHDFSLEHRIVQEYQRIMAEEAAAIEARESAYKLYAEERQARLKQERITMARKIAPGFLDNDDRRILTPTLATAQVKEQTTSTSSAQAITSKYAGNRFDYSEFEARDPADEGSSNRGKDDGSADNAQPSPQGETQRDLTVSPIQDATERESGDGSEEEIIVQAVPLSELTGMLRDSCLEEESSSSAPRTWHERDPASEKSTMPSFNATRLDFREFEQGLGPPDPWDTPVDDLTALKDVISQQMGHSSAIMQQDGSISSSRTQQPQHIQAQQSQHSISQSGYPYQHQHQQHPGSTQQYHQPTDHSIHGQYPYPAANPPPRTAYNSSPAPVASFVPPTKLTGIAQQQAALQHHQQQHRHSTAGIGAHPTTGLTPSQQHARFGNASPSPPPLPPPPRAMTTSPSVHPSTATVTPGGPTAGTNRPRLPARPLRANDTGSTDSPTSAGMDHVTVMDRSMTPPRPPLPPPPHPPTQGASSSSAIGSGGMGGGSTGSISGSGAAPPALKPRPPKDHEMLHGILGSNQKTTPTGMHGGFSEADGRTGQDMDMDDAQQQQEVAPAPPQAESLISHLVSMGFTREQSRSALEKYDYDLEKASNHLLDWDE